MADEMAGTAETLELLYDMDSGRCDYVAKIEEDVTLVDGVLERDTAIHIEVPQVDPGDTKVEMKLPFGYVLRAPRRGDLWSVRDPDVSNGSSCRILAHHEHVEYCRQLIIFRFWSVCARWVKNGGERRRDVARAVLAQLSEIPALSPTAAHVCLDEAFEDGLLKFLGNAERPSTFEKRLYRLCSLLCDRYFVVLAFNCQPGENVSIRYSQQDPLPQLASTADSSFRRRLRLLLGSVPVRSRLHLPLARTTPSFELSFQGPSGTYVYSQQLMSPASLVPGSPTVEYRTVTEQPHGGLRSWRRPPGSSSASLYVINGNESAKSLHLGLTLYERPPGSRARATLLAVGALGAAVTLAFVRWITGGDLSGDVAAVGISILSVILFAIDATMGVVRVSHRSMAARISELVSAVLLFSFAVWLLIPDGTGANESGIRGAAARALEGWMWLPIIFAMLLNAVWIGRRLRRATTRYLDVLINQDAPSSDLWND